MHPIAAGIHSAGEVDTEPVKLEFNFNCSIREDKKQVYRVSCLRTENLFASVGGNIASVYTICSDSSVDLLLAYTDADPEEELYAVAWSLVETPVLLIGGSCGSVKAINILENELVGCFCGHGNSINNIQVHPVDENLILTASKDESIRLWNLQTSSCIAIFCGQKGHRDEVLSIAIHPLGNCFVSGGMDSCMNIWSLESPVLQGLIAKSYRTDESPSSAHYIQFPEYSTSSVHKNYIDCVNWYGNFILSGAVSDKVMLWAPDTAMYSV